MDSFSNKDGKGFVVVLVLMFVICCFMIIGKYYHTKIAILLNKILNYKT